MTSTQTVLSEHGKRIKIATNPTDVIEQTTPLQITDWHMDGKILVTQVSGLLKCDASFVLSKK